MHLKVLKLVEVKAILNKAKFVELKICGKDIWLYEGRILLMIYKYFENKNKIKIDIIADNSLNNSRICD